MREEDIGIVVDPFCRIGPLWASWRDSLFNIGYMGYPEWSSDMKRRGPDEIFRQQSRQHSILYRLFVRVPSFR